MVVASRQPTSGRQRLAIHATKSLPQAASGWRSCWNAVPAPGLPLAGLDQRVYDFLLRSATHNRGIIIYFHWREGRSLPSRTRDCIWNGSLAALPSLANNVSLFLTLTDFPVYVTPGHPARIVAVVENDVHHCDDRHSPSHLCGSGYRLAVDRAFQSPHGEEGGGVSQYRRSFSDQCSSTRRAVQDQCRRRVPATPRLRGAHFDGDTELEGYCRMNTKIETARLRDRPPADTGSNTMLTFRCAA